MLPDPAFPLAYLANGQLDPTQPIAANRIVPLAAAPEYSEGLVNMVLPTDQQFIGFSVNPVLMIEENVVQLTTLGAIPNEPTSWFWNVRVGDKLQLNGAGIWYTVVGPMVWGPAQGNTEMFVNVGAPGTQSTWTNRTQAGITGLSPEFLFLTNGIDDNQNGWIDEGWDGVDNNLLLEQTNGVTPAIDEPGLPSSTNLYGEWEPEAWPTNLAAHAPANVPYTIQRRPAPAQNSREIALPTNVVIDLTTWSTTQERSRLPVNAYTGYVDVMVNPNGTAFFSLPYSTPSSVTMSANFFHFWVAERSDVSAPLPTATAAPFLPIGTVIKPPPPTPPVVYNGPASKASSPLCRCSRARAR